MSKQMDIEKVFDELKRVHPSLPENLSYQTIMNKIKLVQREKAPKIMVMASVLALTALLSLNFMSFRNQDKLKDNNLVNEMGLMNNPSIYGGI